MHEQKKKRKEKRQDLRWHVFGSPEYVPLLVQVRVMLPSAEKRKPTLQPRYEQVVLKLPEQSDVVPLPTVKGSQRIAAGCDSELSACERLGDEESGTYQREEASKGENRQQTLSLIHPHQAHVIAHFQLTLAGLGSTRVGAVEAGALEITRSRELEAHVAANIGAGGVELPGAV
jgi:hypothetical protein